MIKLKTYRATAWLLKEDEVIKMKIFELNQYSKTEFQASIYNELMYSVLPEEGYHVSFGPISEKKCVLFKQGE